MKTRVKFFSDDSIGGLEIKINKFLECSECTEVQEIKLVNATVDYNRTYIVMIVLKI